MPVLIEEGSTEVVKRSFIVMHHHVTLSALIVRQGKMGASYAGTGKVGESALQVSLLLLLGHLGLSSLATLSFLNLPHQFLSLDVVFLLKKKQWKILSQEIKRAPNYGDEMKDRATYVLLHLTVFCVILYVDLGGRLRTSLAPFH